MASTKDNPADSATGFAGLSLMVSDIDTILANATIGKQASQAIATSSDCTPLAAQPPSVPTNRSEQHQSVIRQPTKTSFSARKVFLGIAAVLGLIWLFYEIGDQSTRPAPSSSVSSTRTSLPDKNGVQPLTARSPVPSRPSEEKPPVGTNHVLDPARIRYCLAEDIRLGAAQSVVHSNVPSDVDGFNAMITDYNSRCGEYRYRRGSLERARSEIEPYRSALESEGRSRFEKSQRSSRQVPSPEEIPSRPNAALPVNKSVSDEIRELLRDIELPPDPPTFKDANQTDPSRASSTTATNGLTMPDTAVDREPQAAIADPNQTSGRQ